MPFIVFNSVNNHKIKLLNFFLYYEEEVLVRNMIENMK